MALLRELVVGALRSRLGRAGPKSERPVGLRELPLAARRIRRAPAARAACGAAAASVAQAPLDPRTEERAEQHAEEPAARKQERSDERSDPDHQRTLSANSPIPGTSRVSAAPASIAAANDGSTGMRSVAGMPNFFASSSARDSPNTAISFPQSGHFR